MYVTVGPVTKMAVHMIRVALALIASQKNSQYKHNKKQKAPFRGLSFYRLLIFLGFWIPFNPSTIG